MSEINGENSRVSYSVKELLGRIDRKLESIDLKMDMKADVKDVDALASRVDAQGQRMSAIEQRLGGHERTLKEQQRIEGFNFTRKTLFVTATLWLISIITPLALNGAHP